MTGYRSQPYDPARHDTDAFDSGEPTLDEWLRRHAAGADARRTARTFVWTHAGDPVGDRDPVIAYYSLTGHRLVRDQLPRRLGRGSPDEIPALLLARLAVDRGAQGRGLTALSSPTPRREWSRPPASSPPASSSSSTPSTSGPSPSTNATATPASPTPSG